MMRGGRSKLKAPGRDRDGRRSVGAARRRSACGHEADQGAGTAN